MLKQGDTIKFLLTDEDGLQVVKEGIVYIIDRMPDGYEYDILVEEDNMLYKHVPQKLIL